MTIDERKFLLDGVAKLNIFASDYQIDKLLQYKELLVKWNKTFSLTAIKDSKQLLINHLLDGLTAVPYFVNAKSMLDVGSGMGVPAVILAIMYPESMIVALDSNGKKTSFLLQVKIELGLSNLQVVNKRVEEYKFADGFEIITSRAFADIKLFLELTHHLLAKHGSYLAMKGVLGIDEIANIDGFNHEVIKLSVPFLDAERFLIKLSK